MIKISDFIKKRKGNTKDTNLAPEPSYLSWNFVFHSRQSSKEKGEFSCGWTLMPLLDEAGAVVGNKTFDQQVHGGTPYEKGVEVDPSISRRSKLNQSGRKLLLPYLIFEYMLKIYSIFRELNMQWIVHAKLI